MSNETLSVPEDCLNDVIKVIRTGLEQVMVTDEVRANLIKWCDEEEEYLKQLTGQ